MRSTLPVNIARRVAPAVVVFGFTFSYMPTYASVLLPPPITLAHATRHHFEQPLGAVITWALLPDRIPFIGNPGISRTDLDIRAWSHAFSCPAYPAVAGLCMILLLVSDRGLSSSSPDRKFHASHRPAQECLAGCVATLPFSRSDVLFQDPGSLDRFFVECLVLFCRFS